MRVFATFFPFALKLGRKTYIFDAISKKAIIFATIDKWQQIKNNISFNFQGIGMDYSGTGTPRTMSGATSPTTFLVPASKEKQLSTAITKLCDLSKSATS